VVKHHDVKVHMRLKVNLHKVYLLPKYGGEWTITLYPVRFPGPHSHSIHGTKIFVQPVARDYS